MILIMKDLSDKDMVIALKNEEHQILDTLDDWIIKDSHEITVAIFSKFTTQSIILVESAVEDIAL